MSNVCGSSEWLNENVLYESDAVMMETEMSLCVCVCVIHRAPSSLPSQVTSSTRFTATLPKTFTISQTTPRLQVRPPHEKRPRGALSPVISGFQLLYQSLWESSEVWRASRWPWDLEPGVSSAVLRRENSSHAERHRQPAQLSKMEQTNELPVGSVEISQNSDVVSFHDAPSNSAEETGLPAPSAAKWINRI